MALMPGADYAGVLAAVFGDLVLVPWQRPFRVPAGKVLGTWRAALGPAPLARLQALVLAAVGDEHRDHDYRARSCCARCAPRPTRSPASPTVCARLSRR